MFKLHNVRVPYHETPALLILTSRSTEGCTRIRVRIHCVMGWSKAVRLTTHIVFVIVNSCVLIMNGIRWCSTWLKSPTVSLRVYSSILAPWRLLKNHEERNAVQAMCGVSYTINDIMQSWIQPHEGDLIPKCIHQAAIGGPDVTFWLSRSCASRGHVDKGTWVLRSQHMLVGR